MNGKAYVSKELNSKHRKILEGLLKLPENRECADCETRAPRWASVNLGIFICMQCSGIHRSLGVHISKVRSATLDTWLPEQVAFIQSMGNEKSNSYWEAELPPNYNRVGIENFIRAKYQEKRWVPRDGKAKYPSGVSEEKASVHRPGSRSGHQYANNINHVSEERKIAQPPITNNSIFAPKHSTPATVKVVEQVKPDPKPQEPLQNSEASVPKTEPTKQETSTTPVAARPKVTTLVAAHPQVTTPVVAKPKLDYGTELFNLLSMDDSRGNDSKMSVNEKPWTSFQSSEEKTTAEIYISSNSTESKVLTKYGIEDLINDPPSVTPSFLEKPQKDEKNDIGNLFEKSKMVSPFSVQPQLAVLSQQQSSLMANSAKSSGASQTFPVNVRQTGSNGIQLPNQSRGIVGHQVPGMMMMPVAGQQNYVQMGNGQYAKPTSSSMYTQGTIVAINGMTNIRASRPPSVNPTKLGIKDYDFSSLTQGMFTKR